MVANVKVLPNLQYQALHNLLKVFNRVLCKFQNFIEQFFESCVDSGEKKSFGHFSNDGYKTEDFTKICHLELTVSSCGT